MNPQLFNALVCPKCQGKLTYDAQKNVLICYADKLMYPIVDQIPVLLEESARSLPAESES